MMMRSLMCALVLSSVLSSAQAGWFGHTPVDDASQLKPDASLTFTFPNRDKLGFAPALLSFKASYTPQRPDEKGVPKETRRTPCNLKVPVHLVALAASTR